MKILMITPEVEPYVKVGGLADVVGALPKELAKLGLDVRVVCPAYGSIRRDENWKPLSQPVTAFLGGRTLYTQAWETPLDGSAATGYFIEYNDFFGAPEVYDSPWGSRMDNDRRFALLNRAALNLCYALNWFPDVVHCHDWPACIAPAYLNTTDRETPLGRAAIVLTIHNLQHQGIFSPGLFDWAHLPRAELFRPDGFEAMGSVNLMKGGIYHSTKITTVSPSYAAEIQTPDYGGGLNHILRFKAADLIGIVNGADVEHWNPQHDPHIPANYSRHNLEGKWTCKAALQESFGLPVEPGVPVFGLVSRFVEQKGIDLLLQIVPRLLNDMRIQIVVQGSGSAVLENAARELAGRYPDGFGYFAGYSNPIAHLIYAGSDFFLMPSRFEPCGLSQMYSMIYGTPPIARATGGLIDTIEQYVETRGKGTGFLFEQPSADALYYTVGWACATYYDRPQHTEMLRLNGMRKDFSWTRSAEHYRSVYQWASAARQAAPIEGTPVAG